MQYCFINLTYLYSLLYIFCLLFPFNIVTDLTIQIYIYKLSMYCPLYLTYPFSPNDRFLSQYFFRYKHATVKIFIHIYWFDHLFYKWIRAHVYFHSTRYCQNVLQNACTKFTLPPFFCVLPTFAVKIFCCHSGGRQWYFILICFS